ncbi:hypothetical protein EST38_g9577 [Candolleomyces aberdarensis]|uniref:C3H1-type domain-containing protein n=1 Tax=Candolleomyces aberdarensis TaxID=2316362 RepID=A0A4Q2D9K8_9AGAR|nr:hypothetical protein EST38_g9577 [Candolleomyces aberdarensis]
MDNWYLINPANEVNWAFINHNQTNFPNIVVGTEEHVRIPLAWFTNDNLAFINRNISSFPTQKTSGINDEKPIPILNMHAVANNQVFTCLHRELPDNFAEWLEATNNMINFQALRDIKGSSANQMWFTQHFTFFMNQVDKVRLYDAWKDKDLELRVERREKQARFDRPHYEQIYGIAKESYKADQRAREEMKSELDTLKALVAILSSQKSSSSSSHGRNGGSNRGSHSNNQSFLSSGSGFAANPVCILCGKKGHAVQDHDKSHPKAWPDGTAFWAQQKPDSKSVTTSDGKEICFNYNIHGKASRCSRDSSKCTRLHICSFCGKADHHALSWSCHSQFKPSN